MTDNDNEIIASLKGFTPGPWVLDGSYRNYLCGFYNDKGVIFNFGDETPHDSQAGLPPSEEDAALIAAAPDLHRIANEQAAEIKRLRDALAKGGH
jgi:hypothetical protein